MSSSTSDSQPETDTQSDSKTVEVDQTLYDIISKYLKDEEKSKDTKLQEIIQTKTQRPLSPILMELKSKINELEHQQESQQQKTKRMLNELSDLEVHKQVIQQLNDLQVLIKERISELDRLKKEKTPLLTS